MDKVLAEQLAGDFPAWESLKIWLEGEVERQCQQILGDRVEESSETLAHRLMVRKGAMYLALRLTRLQDEAKEFVKLYNKNIDKAV